MGSTLCPVLVYHYKYKGNRPEYGDISDTPLNLGMVPEHERVSLCFLIGVL